MTLIVFYEPLKTLIVRSLDDEVNDYIPLIPLVSAFFFSLYRRDIFSNPGYSFRAGGGIVIAGVAIYLIGMSQEQSLDENDYLALVTLSCVTIWIGGFAVFLGLDALKKALFPLLFLLFMVPIPSLVLEKMISVLQEGSAEATFLLLQLTGVPFLREGFVFHLTGLSIEVAEQCSGIHSAIALLITSVVAAKLFLGEAWSKASLVLAVFPIAIVKNGLRIVTLALLANYVDARILSGGLHRQGGVPFFVLAVSVLMAVLWLLRLLEKRRLAAVTLK